MEELKPCPFCGCEARVWECIDGTYRVECDCCNARTDVAYSEKTATELWNRRAK